MEWRASFNPLPLRNVKKIRKEKIEKQEITINSDYYFKEGKMYRFSIVNLYNIYNQ